MVGCTNVLSKGDTSETTSTLVSTSNVNSESSDVVKDHLTDPKFVMGNIRTWIESNSTNRTDSSYGGVGFKQSLYEDAKIEIRNSLYALPESNRPYLLRMEKLSSPDDMEGYFQIAVSFSSTEETISDWLDFCIREKYSTTGFINDIEASEFVDKYLLQIPDEEKPNVKICNNGGYTEVEIIFE